MRTCGKKPVVPRKYWHLCDECGHQSAFPRYLSQINIFHYVDRRCIRIWLEVIYMVGSESFIEFWNRIRIRHWDKCRITKKLYNNISLS
jgi:hypothetical protein